MTRPNQSMEDLAVMDLPYRRSHVTRFALRSTETGPRGPPGPPAARTAFSSDEEVVQTQPLPTEVATARARTL